MYESKATLWSGYLVCLSLRLNSMLNADVHAFNMCAHVHIKHQCRKYCFDFGMNVKVKWRKNMIYIKCSVIFISLNIIISLVPCSTIVLFYFSSYPVFYSIFRCTNVPHVPIRRIFFWVTAHPGHCRGTRERRGKKDMDCLVLRSDFSWLPFWKEQPGICCRLARITVSTCSLTVCFILHSTNQVLGPVKSPDKVLKALSVERQRVKETEKRWKETR